MPASLIGDRINEALRDIYDSNDWGFLFTDSYIRTPALISGTLNVNEFDANGIVDAATKVLLDNIVIGQVLPEERQFKVLSPVQTDRGFIYQITGYDTLTGIITFDPPFQDISGTAKQIQIFKSYYTPPTIDIGTPTSPEPVIDFKRFEFIISPQFNRRLWLDTTLNELNAYDPYRINSASEPQVVVPYNADSSSNAQFELYPSPRFERILRVKYLRKGISLRRDTDQVHDLISQELIIERAKQKCYKWILGNMHKIPNIKSGVPYQNLIALSNNKNDFNSYPNLLDRAIKFDEERYPKAYIGDFAEAPYYEGFWNGNGNLSVGETLVLNF